MKHLNLLGIAAVCLVLLSGCKCKKADACDNPSFDRKLPVGVQLYSVRTDLAKDFYGTLKAISEMGYHGVEFNGEFYGHSPLEVKRMCTELGLIPFSNHVPYDRMAGDLPRVLKENSVLGVQYVVFPWMAEPIRPNVNPEKFEEAVRVIGESGPEFKNAGFQLLYHNHDFEFVKMADGELAYDYIFRKTADCDVKHELDVCWSEYAGYNAVELLQKCSGSVPVVHLKDYSTENGRMEFRPLGTGCVDMPAVIEASIAAGAKWLCVEQDEPSMGLNRLESIAKSAEYLRSLGLL